MEPEVEMERRVYTRKYKLEAIKLVREHGVPQNQACRDLGLHINTLRNWLKEYEADPESSFPGHGQGSRRNSSWEPLAQSSNSIKKGGFGSTAGCI